MAKPAKTTILEQLAAIALSLPEASQELHHDHASFLVRRKVFGYFLNNHHGDGIVAIACKVLPGDNAVLVKNDPERFCLPAYIASRGWVSFRLDKDPVDWDEVRDLLTGSYVLVAPKKLADAVQTSPGFAEDGTVRKRLGG